ncbi:MAG: TRAP transporter small permease [Sutterellaceae bacterium]|nr:TRAP transporter small permease [Burkholderiaceae bacterium]MDW8429500.1 TRAP transporter small permease [Sutterellaceae bacterium]
MRGLLDRAYDVAAYLAAVCLIGLLAMVLLSIAGRLFHFFVPGTDAYAGYLMAACGFLALAHTLKRGEHIRVTLLLARLRGRLRYGVELWALAVTAILAAVFAWFSLRLVWQSWVFKDVSTGTDATPLWIPQLAMAAGACLFAVALIDECIGQLRRRRAPHMPAEALRNE